MSYDATDLLLLQYLLEHAHRAIDGPAHTALKHERGLRAPNPRHATNSLLPLEPLMRHAHYATIPQLATALNMSPGALRAIRQRGGVPVHRADDLAIRLGLHPANVWGDAFYQQLDDAA